MSINKNFVVKNGFEASADLILANADTRKVGIGTTTPQYTLHVNGGIGATDFYLTGIGTFVNELNVGLDCSVLTVLGIGNSIGIGTALPAYLLDIRSPVSTGQTALYVQGDVRITGDINADDIVFDDAEIQDLTVTDTFIVAGISTLGVTSISQLNVSGISTLGTVQISSGIITATSGIITYFGDGSNLTGLAGNPTLQAVLNTGNTSTIGMSISGVTTLTTLTGTHINISGICTAQDFDALSDINYKTNILTIENALDKVNELRGVSFDWKKSGFSSYGVIAQELEDVLPELVHGEEPKTVNYNGIIGVLIEAVKELKKEIVELKSTK